MVGLFGISVSAIRTLTPSMTRVVVAGRVLVVVFMAQRSAASSSFAPVETLAWSLAPGSSLRELLGLRGCRQGGALGCPSWQEMAFARAVFVASEIHVQRVPAVNADHIVRCRSG